MLRTTTDPPLRRSLRPRGPVRFRVTEHHKAGAHVVRVHGELDILTASKLAAELDSVIRKNDGNVAIDLRHAVFIDSAGLHILMNAHRRLARASRRMWVVCGEGPVRRVIELARLVETLGVVPSLE
jgi:anti-sigma B factor antagonist